ncbi:MAG: hypothetical protein L3J47_01085 [Sulfurovum sp.]|nr:hypothetical protein [Sulfurovum sp.]
MRKILLNLLTFATVIAIIVVLLLAFGTDEGARYVYKDNTARKPIDITPKAYRCSECNMEIEAMPYMAEMITPEGNTYFFDDIGCLVLWQKTHTVNGAKAVTKTVDTQKWLDVQDAWYSRTDSTPMGYGFAAYEKRQKGMIPYDEMRTLMLQGKNLHDPFVKKQLLGQNK